MSSDLNYEFQDASLDYLRPKDDYSAVVDLQRRRAINIENMKTKVTNLGNPEEPETTKIVVQPSLAQKGHMERLKKQLSLDNRPISKKMVRRGKVGAMPEDTSSVTSGTRHPHPHAHAHEHTNSVANLFHHQFHHRESYLTEELLAKFNKDELAEYHQLFSMFDTDGSGAIGSEELKEAILSIGVQVSDTVDEDGNGEIDFGEFCHCMKKSQNLAKSTNEEIARQCFEIFDQDKNGVITENEFKYIAKEIGGFSDELAEYVFHELDISSNGHLSADQFLAIVEDYLLSDHTSVKV